VLVKSSHILDKECKRTINFNTGRVLTLKTNRKYPQRREQAHTLTKADKDRTRVSRKDQKRERERERERENKYRKSKHGNNSSGEYISCEEVAVGW
jgi:hypothetical protein